MVLFQRCISFDRVSAGIGHSLSPSRRRMHYQQPSPLLAYLVIEIRKVPQRHELKKRMVSRFRQTLPHALASLPEAQDIIRLWPQTIVPQLLALLWEGYDRLYSTKLSKVRIEDADIQLERALTALLHDEIQMIIAERGGHAGFLLRHESWELETLNLRPTRPPQYDLAFVWFEKQLLQWPCEAKVLRTAGAVADYVADVRDAFLTCIYAPFSSSGAMLGLLFQGDATFSFERISATLPSTLIDCVQHPDRPHRISRHARIVPSGKPYPCVFECHHLILPLCAESHGDVPA